MSRRVLVVAHNHPAFHAGGTEIFALDLFHAYKRAGCEALFLGATNSIHRQPHPGTSFQSVGEGGDEVVVWAGHFDRLMMSQIDLHGIVPDLASLLETFRPEIVHLHHLLLIGAEFPALIRRILPDCLVVMTLHDYYPICAHDGLMVHRHDRALCRRADPNGCHRCLPEVPATRFLLRELGLKAHLEAVDLFLAPSEFLRQRYIEWGIAETRIVRMANGRPAEAPAPHRRALDARRAVFGYFGNLNPWKGIVELLEACRRLEADGVSFELHVHGEAPFQSEAFTADLAERFETAGGSVVRHGQYDRADLPQLIAGIDWVVVPSVWWENAPLVMLEAQLHHRPLIVSGIGGMAELVQDGRNGLHARPGDPLDLARVMRRCCEEPGLWRRLASGAIAPDSIDVVAQRHLALFEQELTTGDRDAA